ncbi:hypothetical protein GGX14DRAFT_393700 [Mycena pura]|uniref:Uncharacterized protein n=1 Tax=Mycena pura TaxID=153505 RepID=A0AAD6YEB5_9AGAR|nr:hypothetical protein GGX14DRAFT_393700 [Mycena pura]
MVDILPPPHTPPRVSPIFTLASPFHFAITPQRARSPITKTSTPGRSPSSPPSSKRLPFRPRSPHMPQLTQPPHPRSSPPTPSCSKLCVDLDLPPAEVLDDPFGVLAWYLSEESAHHLSESGPYAVCTFFQEDFHIQASHDTFAKHLCRYFNNLHPWPQNLDCCEFGAMTVATILLNIFHELESVHLLIQDILQDSTSVASANPGGSQTSSGTQDSRVNGKGESARQPGKSNEEKKQDGKQQGGGEGGDENRDGDEPGEGGNKNRDGDEPGADKPRVQTWAKFFSSVDITAVAIPSRRTPPYNCQVLDTSAERATRRTACHTQALAFSEALFTHTTIPLQPFIYAPGQPPSLGKGELYHGTRWRFLKDFRTYGVDPRLKAHANFFSASPSFNLTNSPEQAISHVLHGGPTNLSVDGTRLPGNALMVLAFEVHTDAIVGSARTKSIALEAPGEILNDEDTRWIAQNFAAGGGMNNSDEDITETSELDWVIRPFLIPMTRAKQKIAKYQVVDSWTSNPHPSLHVAATSLSAFNMLNDQLIGNFVEEQQVGNPQAANLQQ